MFVDICNLFPLKILTYELEKREKARKREKNREKEKSKK